MSQTNLSTQTSNKARSAEAFFKTRCHCTTHVKYIDQMDNIPSSSDMLSDVRCLVGK